MKIQVSLFLTALAAVAPSAHASCNRATDNTIEDWCCLSGFTPTRRRLQGLGKHRKLSGLDEGCIWPNTDDSSLSDLSCVNQCDFSCNSCLDIYNFCAFVWGRPFFDGTVDRFWTVCDDGVSCCPRDKTESPPTGYGDVTFKGLCQAVQEYDNFHDIDDGTAADLDYGKWCPYYRSSGGSANGDPHFRTWTGDHFDFMGGCDLTLIHAPDFDEQNDMTITIRTKVESEFSYIESAALKIGHSVLQINSYGEYHLNGIDGVHMPAFMSGYRVRHEIVNKKTQLFTVELDGDEAIVFQIHKAWVSVKINSPSNDRFATSVGMMGEFKTGHLLGRDGETIVKDPEALAREWQVREDELMLFQTVQGPQYPEKCQMPDLTQETSRRLQGSVSEEDARKACERAGHTQETMEGCIIDVIHTQDLEMADAGAF